MASDGKVVVEVVSSQELQEQGVKKRKLSIRTTTKEEVGKDPCSGIAAARKKRAR